MRQYGKPEQILTHRGTQFHPRGRHVGVHGVLQRKQYRANGRKCAETIQDRDRGFPQGLRVRVMDVSSVRRGKSNFDPYCERSKIKHILGGIGKPTTLEKIDRWFRSYDLEHTRFPRHWKFVEYYNYERPHMVLNYSTPAEGYFRDVLNFLGQYSSHDETVKHNWRLSTRGTKVSFRVDGKLGR